GRKPLRRSAAVWHDFCLPTPANFPDRDSAANRGVAMALAPSVSDSGRHLLHPDHSDDLANRRVHHQGRVGQRKRRLGAYEAPIVAGPVRPTVTAAKTKMRVTKVCWRSNVGATAPKFADVRQPEVTCAHTDSPH